MAFDGIMVAGLKAELTRELIGMHLSKIAQPEADELLLTFKGNSRQRRLLISVSASLPFLYLIDSNKPGPITAPNFCMVLRKHLGSGRLVEITQPSLERILIFTFEHLNELGDLCQKKLIVELMGKHSNLIFCDGDQIIDSIKHVSARVSSVREVLPGRTYFIPQTTAKKNPFESDAADFIASIREKPEPIGKAIYGTFTGLSPVSASELCYQCHLDSDQPVASLQDTDSKDLGAAFVSLMDRIRKEAFSPVLYQKNGEPVEFSAIPLSSFSDCTEKGFGTLSEMLISYYSDKAAYTRIRQKSSDLRHIVNTAYERTIKKYDLQTRQLKDTEKKDRYRTYGELLTAYAHAVPSGAKSFDAEDYHTGESVTIPLDPTLAPNENAQKFFSRYQKLKRTEEALSVQLSETEAEKAHLESVLMSLDLAESEEDLTPIRMELLESGYLRRRSGDKKAKDKSRPYHYLSSDGFDLYVGKNNFQNDELTFKLANGGDLWFHAKKMPGSHVILRTGGREVPDRAYEEAASLAAYYSRGRGSEKVEVDYLHRKDVRKTPGTPPGYVIYYTNYSMTVNPSLAGLTLLSD